MVGGDFGAPIRGTGAKCEDVLSSSTRSASLVRPVAELDGRLAKNEKESLRHHYFCPGPDRADLLRK